MGTCSLSSISTSVQCVLHVFLPLITQHNAATIMLNNGDVFRVVCSVALPFDGIFHESKEVL